MSAPVDVLAVMDAVHERANECVDFSVAEARASDAARAAVTELIEAGKSLAAAQIAFDRHRISPDEYSAAWERHDAALARAQGGSK